MKKITLTTMILSLVFVAGSSAHAKNHHNNKRDSEHLSDQCSDLSGNTYEIPFRGNGLGWSQFTDYKLKLAFEPNGSGLKGESNYGIDTVTEFISRTSTKTYSSHSLGYWNKKPDQHDYCGVWPSECLGYWQDLEDAIGTAKKRMSLVKSNEGKLTEYNTVLDCASERVHKIKRQLQHMADKDARIAMNNLKKNTVNIEIEVPADAARDVTIRKNGSRMY